jgi:UDP-N-acetylmuramoylalanine--D-glutamate ligase
VKDIKGQKALVVGLGHRSGLAACNFLARRGCSVTGSDIKSAADLAPVVSKLDPAVTIVTGAQEPALLDAGFDLLVLSPGVPQSIPLVKEAYRRGIPVISEIELAFRFMKGQAVGITGTDGKSTTTTLTGHLLAGLGIKTFVGGNIGVPLVSLVDDMDGDSVTVIELSSFQLETIRDFRADAAAVLNITPDHLDRYPGMKEYAAAKMRIAENQAPDNAFVYYLDDENLRPWLGNVKSRKMSFSLASKGADAFLDNGMIYLRRGGSARPVLEASRMTIIGRHNVLNAMASLLLVLAILDSRGIAPDYARLAELCAGFTGLPHRMERVGEYEGRTFINDSKATTVGAVEMALDGFSGNAVLILGGRTKGDDYSRLAKSIRGKLRGLVLMGESNGEFAAMKLSETGDSILLSPACASFDMFKSFEERGEKFRDSFTRLATGELKWT